MSFPCDHKFIDSKRCLKCGWSPPPCEVVTSPSVDDCPEASCGKVSFALVNGFPMCAAHYVEYQRAGLVETTVELPDTER